LTGVFAGVLEFLAWNGMNSVVPPAAFTPAFGRVECRFAAVFRREAEASLYLEAKARTKTAARARAKARARATAKTKAKCGGLSTAPWTVKLSMASVEMTQFLGSQNSCKARTTATADMVGNHLGREAGFSAALLTKA
jgi:hypothetical protein